MIFISYAQDFEQNYENALPQRTLININTASFQYERC
jgi:hypothetical protein